MKIKAFIAAVSAAAAVFAAGFSVYAADGVKINEKNFPDSIFREYIAKDIDKNGDGKLSESEIKDTNIIHVRGKKIGSLKGIEFFTELTYLNCEDNNISSLDVSKNKKLSNLVCSNNALTKLDVSKNKKLTILDCFGNGITKLNTEKNTRLEYLVCDSNRIESLKLGKNKRLKTLYCGNNSLKKLDISGNTELQLLSCYKNTLKKLDISKHDMLYYLDCSENELTSVDIGASQITGSEYPNYFECSGNALHISAKVGEKYDLSELEKYGFDLKKAKNWKGASLDEKSSTVKITKKRVTYTYDCGNGFSEVFTLIPSA